MLTEFKEVSGGWLVGSFVGGTLDAIFNIDSLNKRSKTLGTLAALSQMTIGTVISVSLLNRVYRSNYETGLSFGTDMISPLAMWSMSPQATGALEHNYKSLHKLLYGTELVEPACCSDCAGDIPNEIHSLYDQSESMGNGSPPIVQPVSKTMY